MDKFKSLEKQKKTKKRNLGIIIVTATFAIIGLICIIIGFRDEMLQWMLTFGVVICVICFPIAVFLIFNMIMNKVKEM